MPDLSSAVRRGIAINGPIVNHPAVAKREDLEPSGLITQMPDAAHLQLLHST